MTDFVKEYDIKHKIQRLYVHWDVSTQCNFKCTYCYAMKEYGDEWGKIDKWFKQKLIINNIGRSTLPIFLGLLGGEPTLHPRYDELIDRCYSAIEKHKDGRLYVTTNGSRESKFFENHKLYNRMYFLFSFHPEYEGKYGKDFETLVNNIIIARRRGFRCKVNVMLHNESKFWEKTHKFVDAIEKIEGLEIHPHFLYAEGDVHQLEEYNKQFYEEFERFKDYPEYFTFEDKHGVKTIFNDYNIFQREQTGFKGWDCWNNNYEISYDGIIHRVCFEDRVDAVKDIYFFKNIKKVCPVICPHNECNCDGLLKIYKEKNKL
jgi:MoaA/NifB/PqqE/SkfB family radical SAM enzyme